MTQQEENQLAGVPAGSEFANAGVAPSLQPAGEPGEEGKAKKKGRGCWWVGCGGGCLGVIVLVLVGVFGGGHYLVKLGEDMAAAQKQVSEYEKRGFKVVRGGNITVSAPVTEKTVYVCDSLMLMADASEEIVVIAPTCNIGANCSGGARFFGFTLIVHPGVELSFLQGWAYVLVNEGTITTNDLEVRLYAK